MRDESRETRPSRRSTSNKFRDGRRDLAGCAYECANTNDTGARVDSEYGVAGSDRDQERCSEKILAQSLRMTRLTSKASVATVSKKMERGVVDNSTTASRIDDGR
jgi:hypothetical protein